ncbi:MULTISPECIES: prolyl aminopeptidase [Nocardiopsis]|uniref:prolyl aminopeptidase n=1 Tax=Nocardiopsis TaxID=2013 RepID=UPI00034A4FF7|nr:MULTISPECIES: prolyl aminopeptidase [Nocardiopsis]PWV46800.1 proline iminopeptidase [Nocardiopsis sp. L17-MgMaSL7]
MYTATTPHTSGHLTRPDGHRLFWQECGNPHGTPLLAVHGGPGSGSHPHWSALTNPDHYRMILLDQRGTGHSTPDIAHPTADLTTNTTPHLIDDFDALRTHLGITRWHVLGASWGSCLGLAYAQAHPDHVISLTLFAVTTGTRAEITWITHDMRRVFPEQWERFRAAAGPDADPRALPAAYAHLLADPDPQVRHDAAQAWCAWEDTHVATVPGFTPNPRYADPAFRLTFARAVTHYWANDCFLAPNQLMDDLDRVTHIPATLINGRLDISGPADTAHDLAQRWPAAELVIVDDAAHTSGTLGIGAAVVAATDRYAHLD